MGERESELLIRQPLTQPLPGLSNVVNEIPAHDTCGATSFRRGNHASQHLVALGGLIVLLAGVARSQDGTWIVSASVGYARLALDEVDGDNSRDLEGWHNLGFLAGPFRSMKNALELAGRVGYRYSRDVSVSLSAAHARTRVSTSYRKPERELSMERSAGFTDVALGFFYHTPLSYPLVEGHAGVELGILWARAAADAYATETFKRSDTTETITYVDTRGDYSRSKLLVSAIGGCSVRLSGPLLLSAEVKYRIAKVGKLEGEVTRLGRKNDESTSVAFDFSGLVVSVGLGIVF